LIYKSLTPQELLDAVASAEVLGGELVPCRRPGEPLNPRFCGGCPVRWPCDAYGIRHPGSLGKDGDPTNDPVKPFKTRWRSRISELFNKEDT
jgi:hypothetical protein